MQSLTLPSTHPLTKPTIRHINRVLGFIGTRRELSGWNDNRKTFRRIKLTTLLTKADAAELDRGLRTLFLKDFKDIKVRSYLWGCTWVTAVFFYYNMNSTYSKIPHVLFSNDKTVPGRNVPVDSTGKKFLWVPSNPH